MRIKKINQHYELNVIDDWERGLLKLLMHDQDILETSWLVQRAEDWFILLIRDPINADPTEIFRKFAERLENSSKFIKLCTIPRIEELNDDRE